MLLSASAILCTTLLFTRCTKEKYPTEEFLYIDDLSKPELTPLEKVIFKKAGHRAWDYMVEAGEFSLQGTSADKLHMDNRLFTVWSDMIDMAASNPDGITLPLHTKVQEMDPWGPLDPLYDIAAGTISGYMGIRGWGTARNLFNMWYTSSTSSYRLSGSEWFEVQGYARQTVGNNYRNNPVYVNGRVQYRNEVSFYGAGSNLRFSYGTATVTFNEYGDPIKFNDTYDFNSMSEGGRTIEDESITRAIGTLGDLKGVKGPVEIYYP